MLGIIKKNESQYVKCGKFFEHLLSLSTNQLTSLSNRFKLINFRLKNDGHYDRAHKLLLLAVVVDVYLRSKQYSGDNRLTLVKKSCIFWIEANRY